MSVNENAGVEGVGRRLSRRRLSTLRKGADMREDRTEDVAGKMFVGGLASDVDETALEKFFARFGRLSEVMVIKDVNTRVSRGFGFVTFENPLDAADALKGVYGKVLNGSAIRCEPATKPKHGAYPPSSRGGERGPPRGGRGGGQRFMGRSRGEGDGFRDSVRPPSRRPGYGGDGDPFSRPRSPRDSFPPERPRRREFPFESREYLPERRGFPPERRDFHPERRDLSSERREHPHERRDFLPERREVRPELRAREILDYGERRGYPPARRDDPYERRDIPLERREFPERHSREFPPERRAGPPERRELAGDRRSFSDDRALMAPSRGLLPERRERESPRDYGLERDAPRDYLSPRDPAGRDRAREQPLLRSFGNGHEVSSRTPFEREYPAPEPRGPRDAYGDREPAPRSIPRGSYPPARGGPRDDPLGPPSRESGRGAREMYSLDDAGFGRDPYPPRRSGGPFTDDPPAKRLRGPPSHPPRGGGPSRYGR